MHAFGNDFAIFDFRNEHIGKEFTTDELIILTDRNFGIGCDQLITIHKCQRPDDEKGVNVSIRVFNFDGTEAMNCGNGVRCVVGYIAQETDKPLVRVQIGNRMMLGKPDRVTKYAKVNMGIPIVNGEFVEMGNKHKVIVVNDIDNITAEQSNEYNVHYVQVRSKEEVFMRSIERGSGETLSCGSGTCAVAAYCIANGLTEKKLRVFSRGSDIMDTSAEVSWDGEGKPMLISGGYTFVFTGEIQH